ncbi:MAG: hypothetical protein JJU44_00085 [Planctomycetes bacterium]|nr:hypothetical protein [Planctomycetota bacterium]
MIRLVAILLLMTSGNIRFFLGGTPVHGDCAHPACAPQLEMQSCCSEPPSAGDYCPMSGGPCECGVSPLPDPQPVPHAPFPKTDRDSLTAVRAPPITIETLLETEAIPLRSALAAPSLLSGLTHNEIQALLCIWQT